ncbi:arylesterase [Undibacterium piscinae]|jgi:acyl-CoA thioesterase-1|uniref:Arylesterase n=1 Tax=Undibacterium piscinae TaxID=2495591 RepID=A0A6M4A1L7_9BURK|nr:arylesterase [Undibacterium piscinae]
MLLVSHKYNRKKSSTSVYPGYLDYFSKFFLFAVIALFCTAAHSASKTVLVLGDSLSAEYGIARGSGWVALLEQRLQQNKIDATVINASISGETSSGGKARLAALLTKYHPHILIIELGANDALRGLALGASETNFRDMIRMSKQAKTKVLLVGMQIPPNYGRDYTERFFSIYPRVAKDTNTALVPFLLAGVADKPELFQADRLHLLATAHPAILDNIWPQLHLLLKQ